MNTKVSWIVIGVILAGVIGMAAWFYSTKDQRARRAAVMQLPEFTGVDEQGRLINNEVIEDSKGVLVFISLTCPYCQQEVKDIRENIAEFKSNPVYIVSSENAIHNEFADEFDLRNVDGLNLIKSDYEVFKRFKITAIPQTMIYDKKGKLLERVEGYVPAKAIADYLN